MKVFINTRFKGFYPVGTAAVVVANNVEEACTLLNEELAARGLDATTVDKFTQIKTNKPFAEILLDGDY